MHVVCCIDREGKILRISKGIEKITGLRQDMVVNSPFARLFNTAVARQVAEVVEQLSGETVVTEFSAPIQFSEPHSAAEVVWHIRTFSQGAFSLWVGRVQAGSCMASSPSPATASAPALSCTQSSATAFLQAAPYAAIIEQMSDALVVVDTQWMVTAVNGVAQALLEKHPQELVGKNLWSAFPEEVDGPLHTACLQAATTHQLIVIEKACGPQQKYYENRVYPSATGLLIFFSDISHKKQSERQLMEAATELENFKAAVNSSAIISTTDADGLITSVNENFCSLLQCCEEALIGRKHSVLDNPFHSPAVSQEIWDTFKKGQVWRGEVCHRAMNGTPVWTYCSIVPIKDQTGRSVRSVILCRDITSRKKAEKELQQSEKLYRTLIENYSDAVLLVDLQGNITKANRLMQELASMSEEALRTKNFLQFLSPLDRDKISTALPLLMQGNSLEFKTTITFFQPSFTARVALVPIQLDESLQHFFIKIRDIRQQEEHEQDLHLLNDTSLALSSTPLLNDGINEVLRLVNHYAKAQYAEFWMPLFGQHLLKMKGSWPTDNKYRLMRAAAEYKVYDYRTEKQHLFQFGKWHFVGNISEDGLIRRKAEAASCGLHAYLSVPIIYRNSMQGMVVLFFDTPINSLHLDPDKLQLLLGKLGSELERRQSNEEQHKFFNVSPDLLGIFTFDGYGKKFNPAFERVLGYSVDEMYQLNVHEIFHPSDRQRMAQVAEKMHQGHAFTNLEVRCRTKAGDYRWMSCTTQSIPAEGLTYMAARDITAQKLQQEEIERITIAVESTSDAIGIATDLSWCSYTNKAFERLLGWNVSNLNERGWTSIFVDAELPVRVVDILSKETSWEGDVELYDNTGAIRPFNLRANTFLNRDGSLKYLIGIFTDITKQKAAQREVMKLSKAVEESANEVYIFDTDVQRISYVNKRGQYNLGYSMAEILQLSPVAINAEYNRLYYHKLLQPLLAGKVKSVFFRTVHTRKDGSQYPVETHLSWFQEGANKALMAHVIDISEQKKAEQALVQSNERYQLVTRATNDAIWDYDVQSQLCYYGEGYKTLFGHDFGNTYSSQEYWAKHIHPEDAERVLNNFTHVAANGINEWVIEYRFGCADGSYKYVKDRGYVIYDALGNATRLAGALADISEQKKSETLLKEFNQELSKKVEEKTSKLAHALRLMRYEVLARIKTEEVLQQSVEEKEVLLKEIHHRVKNNMAIISGLLSLQARNVQQPELKAVLKDSQSRIKSMALVHELLYQSPDLSRVNFKQYVLELAQGISVSFQHLDKEVTIDVTAEDAELDIVHAVPCALILNELITNSFKYAFVNKDKGQIKINFIKQGAMHELCIIDNGVGLPPSFTPQKARSLGMQLVYNLVKQIGGEIVLAREEGTSFTIRW